MDSRLAVIRFGRPFKTAVKGQTCLSKGFFSRLLDKDLASHTSHVTRLANRIVENAGLTATKLVSLKEAALLH